MTFEPYNRVKTRFPHIPTDQPQCVEDLSEIQKLKWLDFAKSTLEILDKKNNVNMLQLVVIIILIIIILILFGMIAYFIYKYASKRSK